MATREYQFIVGPETSTLPTAGTPTDDLDIITKGFADSHYAQGKLSVADITALKAVTNTGSTARVNGDIIEVQSTNAVYVFDSDSALSGNDDTVVTPTAGTGRWLKVGAPIAASTDNRLPKYDGTGGGLQTTGITVDDSNNVTGVNNMTIDGDLTVKGTTTSIETTNLQVEDANILINDGGNDATSEGAGLTVERTGTNGSLIYANAATSKFKVGALGSEVEIADISSSQVFANKTISYASNTITGVQPTSTLTTKGDLYAATASSTVTRLGAGSDGQILVADSTQTTGLKWTTANSGSKNYFIYNSFENNATTGWSLGNVSLTTNFPSGVPTFGSGASGNLSISAVSGSPIAGTYALSYASSAATTAGDFVSSDAFTIDNEDQAKILAFRFSYKVQSGTVDMSGTTSNSFGVAIYDVTNAAWIQPAGVFNLVQNSGIGIATGTFQTSANGTSYRLLIYNANATSGAVTMYFDTFFVGPQVTSIAPAMSNWKSYTPTMTNGTNATASGQWRQVGDSMQLYLEASWSGSGSGGIFRMSLPSGFSIDTSKHSPSGLYGSGQWYQGATGFAGTEVRYVSATELQFTKNAANAFLSGTDFLSGYNITVAATVPIVGWSSNTVSSADTDTRIVALSAGNSSNNTNILTTATGLSYNSINLDTHGAFNQTTYTIPISGNYRITHSPLFNVTGYTSAAQLDASIFVDASVVSFQRSLIITGTGFYSVSTSYTAFLKAGQAVTFAATKTGTGITANLHTDVTGSRVSVERLSGPAVVQATETVAALYKPTTPTGTLSSTFNLVTFGTKIKDSHNSYSSGLYTIPVSGQYDIEAQINILVSSYAAGQYRGLAVFVDGSEYISRFIQVPTASGFNESYLTVSIQSVPLIAGQVVSIRSYCDGTSPSFNTAPNHNFFSIKRSGNY